MVCFLYLLFFSFFLFKMHCQGLPLSVKCLLSQGSYKMLDIKWYWDTNFAHSNCDMLPTLRWIP